MTKKISFVLGSLGRGGAERVASILAHEYISKGWAVDIILLLDNRIEYDLSPKIRVIYIGHTKRTRLNQIPHWIIEMHRYFKHNRPDTILSFAARINLLSYVANIGIKNNLVVSERNDPLKDGRSIVIKLATNFVYKRVDKVIFQTKRAQSYFSKKIQANSVVIYNPVTVLENYKYNRSKIIVNVGRLEHQKNQKLLIDAYYNIQKRYPDYKLMIFGEGSLRSELQAYIESLNLDGQVFMPGNVKNIHEYMARSEMFILSSDYEGLSNALLESLMMGIPTISTTCAGSDEIIKNGENGLLVPTKDTRALSISMELLIKDSIFAEKMGLNAKKSSFVFETNHVMSQWEKNLSL